jgi:hypothetical protein
LTDRPDEEPSRPEPPEADFGATLRYMGLIFGAIALLALALGWLLTRR